MLIDNALCYATAAELKSSEINASHIFVSINGSDVLKAMKTNSHNILTCKTWRECTACYEGHKPEGCCLAD